VSENTDLENFKEVSDFHKVLWMLDHIKVLIADAKLKNQIIVDLEAELKLCADGVANFNECNIRLNRQLDKTSKQKEYILKSDRRYILLKKDYKELKAQYGRY